MAKKTIQKDKKQSTALKERRDTPVCDRSSQAQSATSNQMRAKQKREKTPIPEEFPGAGNNN